MTLRLSSMLYTWNTFLIGSANGLFALVNRALDDLEISMNDGFSKPVFSMPLQ